MQLPQSKTWPIPPEQEPRFQGANLKRLLALRERYLRSVYVDEGHLETRRLGATEFTRVIPPGESAITALVKDGRGRIFGGTGGTQAHLFYYDPAPDADTVLDVGVIGPAMSVAALVALADGRIFGATRPFKKGAAGQLFVYLPCEYLFRNAPDRHGPEGYAAGAARKIMDTPPMDRIVSSMDDSNHACGRVELLSAPLAGEGIGGLVLGRDGKTLYGLGDASGTLFRYDLAAQTGAPIGVVDEVQEFSRPLILGPAGKVYGAGAEGRLWRYDPAADRIEFLAAAAPALKGRALYTRVDSWAQDEYAGLIYGGTNDGLIFSFCPASGAVTTLGKPVKEERVRALTVGLDGRVYGVAGEANGMAHLFLYDPATRDLRDLGLPLAAVEEHWSGYEFSAAATGQWGEIYLGEHDRISHLFIYFPPIARRARPAGGDFS